MVDDRTALMSARALSPGYEILWYTIDKVLGQGGFGITYLAHDRNLNRAVAIKEYLPTTFAYRHQDYSVKPITGDHRDSFVWGLGSFQKEAQTLARFSHPNIVRVHSVFEANNTAYMVMEYEHGQNLANIYKQHANLGQAFFEQVFFPIFDGLKEIHKFDFIHRDIKPANIYIREDGTPVLIDFGSARQTTQQQTNEITTLVSQGYTPLEQYSANYGDQGPWTDIYALAATIYEGIVGKKPAEALSRSACQMRAKPDLLQFLDAQIYPGFNQQFLDAVFVGLKLEPELRPQSLGVWSGIFEHGDTQFDSPLNIGKSTQPEHDDSTRMKPGRLDPLAADIFPNDDDTADIPTLYRRNDPRSNTGRQFSNTDRSFNAGQTQPRGFTESFSPPPLDTQRDRFDNRDEGGFFRQDDLLAFDDEDLETESRARVERPGVEPVRHDKPSVKRKDPALAICALALIAAIGAGGAYHFLGDGSSKTPGLPIAALDGMPEPAQSVAIVLPEENVQSQLDSMLQLATLLSQAYELNPSDSTLLTNVRSTEVSLLALTRQWNASKHKDIASKIEAVSQALPAEIHDQERIEAAIEAAGDVTANAQVMALLEGGKYLNPTGNSVLDKITAVSARDYQKIRESSQWRDMMSGFTHTAMEKLKQSKFDEVARLTEAALTLDADDAGFNAVRDFLSNR